MPRVLNQTHEASCACISRYWLQRVRALKQQYVPLASDGTYCFAKDADDTNKINYKNVESYLSWGFQGCFCVHLAETVVLDASTLTIVLSQSSTDWLFAMYVTHTTRLSYFDIECTHFFVLAQQ